MALALIFIFSRICFWRSSSERVSNLTLKEWLCLGDTGLATILLFTSAGGCLVTVVLVLAVVLVLGAVVAAAGVDDLLLAALLLLLLAAEPTLFLFTRVTEAPPEVLELVEEVLVLLELI